MLVAYGFREQCQGAADIFVFRFEASGMTHMVCELNKLVDMHACCSFIRLALAYAHCRVVLPVKSVSVLMPLSHMDHYSDLTKNNVECPGDCTEGSLAIIGSSDAKSFWNPSSASADAH